MVIKMAKEEMDRDAEWETWEGSRKGEGSVPLLLGSFIFGPHFMFGTWTVIHVLLCSFQNFPPPKFMSRLPFQTSDSTSSFFSLNSLFHSIIPFHVYCRAQKEFMSWEEPIRGGTGKSVRENALPKFSTMYFFTFTTSDRLLPTRESFWRPTIQVVMRKDQTRPDRQTFWSDPLRSCLVCDLWSDFDPLVWSGLRSDLWSDFLSISTNFRAQIMKIYQKIAEKVKLASKN